MTTVQVAWAIPPKSEIFELVQKGRPVIPLLEGEQETLDLTEEEVALLVELGASPELVKFLRDHGHVRSGVAPTPTKAAEEDPSLAAETPAPPPPGPPPPVPPRQEESARVDASQERAAAETPPQADTPPVVTPSPPTPMRHPRVFGAETAHLVPSGVIYSTGGIDTAGGLSGTSRIGLGEVSEFGVETTDAIRSRSCSSCEPESIAGYSLAHFKLGVSEAKLGWWQPAVAINFRKSFNVQHEGRDTQVAELSLIFSKKLWSVASLHAGASFWDASIEHNGREVTLHDSGLDRQVRPFGGFELVPLPKARIMVELHWVPELELNNIAGDGRIDSIELRPLFAWGVRHELADWFLVEAGVKLPDIHDANLIDAQIFGQVTFATRFLNRWAR